MSGAKVAKGRLPAAPEGYHLCRNGVALRAAAGRVLVTAEEAPEQSGGGIVMPDNVRQAHGYSKGVVVSAGAVRDGWEPPAVGVAVYFLREHTAGVQEGEERLFSIAVEDLLAERARS